MSLAVYVHWPFCQSKCPYCDFNSHVADHIDYQQWLASYLAEIRYFKGQLAHQPISSIFFGGGTPTLMPPYFVEEILACLLDITSLSQNIEITLEGNTTSVEANKLKDFKAAGINRVSLGVQALNAADLAFLGRKHSIDEALNAIKITQQLFDNYSFDLIYARPGQTVASWRSELKQAMDYVGNHLSLYQLTIEKGTAFYTQYRAGGFELPNEDLSTDLYQTTQEILEKQHLYAYEISNYAKSGFESTHNLSYWRYHDYLGLGPGAHSRLTIDGQKQALMMKNLPQQWLESIANQNNAVQLRRTLPKEQMAEEYLIMGLRIKEGISISRYAALAGRAFDTSQLEKLVNEKLITLHSDTLQCTEKGKLLINSLVSELSCP